jgi:putative Holliday junction resolvase
MTDPTRTIVTPASPVLKPDTDSGFESVVELIRDSEARGVVVGLPLSLSGEDTAQTQVAKGFATRLGKALDGVWIELLDERLTTSEARNVGGASSEDSRAAAVLLERWLERNPQ